MTTTWVLIMIICFNSMNCASVQLGGYSTEARCKIDVAALTARVPAETHLWCLPSTADRKTP